MSETDSKTEVVSSSSEQPPENEAGDPRTRTQKVTGAAGSTAGDASRTIGGTVGSAIGGVGDIASAATGDALKPLGDGLGLGGEYLKGGGDAVAEKTEGWAGSTKRKE